MVGTNVVLDVLLNRTAHVNESAAVLKAASDDIQEFIFSFRDYGHLLYRTKGIEETVLNKTASSQPTPNRSCFFRIRSRQLGGSR